MTCTRRYTAIAEARVGLSRGTVMPRSGSYPCYGSNGGGGMAANGRVWIDFENAPHVWVLTPIIEHLRSRGYDIVLTARDFSYTVDLCKRLGHDVQVVGLAGSGRGKVDKVRRVLDRAARLYGLMSGCRKDVALALSHSSRSQVLAAHFLGISVLALSDYEYSNQSQVRFVDRLLVPFPINPQVWGRYAGRVQHFPGLKEELYLCGFRPAEDAVPELSGVGDVKVLLRCEGRSTHYHSAKSEVLQEAVLERLVDRNVYLVLLPRDGPQGQEIAAFCNRRGLRYWLPEGVVDGPALLWHADLVVGGGGTMTREAAVLGIPSYSFFGGRIGAVDRYLEAQGRLIQITEPADAAKIVIQKRTLELPPVRPDALNFVTGVIDNILDAARSGRYASYAPSQ
jgi:uncharacterized protein